MIVIEGSTVDHMVSIVDHRLGTAEVLCTGDEGEPISKDADEIELCDRCIGSLDDPESRLPDELIPDDTDDDGD